MSQAWKPPQTKSIASLLPQTTTDKLFQALKHHRPNIWAQKLPQTTFTHFLVPQTKWVRHKSHHRPNLSHPYYHRQPQTTIDQMFQALKTPQTILSILHKSAIWHIPHFVHFIVPQTKWVGPKSHHRPNLLRPYHHRPRVSGLKVTTDQILSTYHKNANVTYHILFTF